MLADSRIESVIGRMMLLVISINTIKFIKAMGVPIGTVCANILFVLLIQPKIIIDIQIVNAEGRAIIIWDVGVNVNGDRAIKFIINKEKKIINIVLVVPLCLWGIIKDFSSFKRGIKIELIFIFHLIEFFFLLDKIIIAGIIKVSHLIDIIVVEGSKIENKLFIIFRLCFLI